VSRGTQGDARQGADRVERRRRRVAANVAKAAGTEAQEALSSATQDARQEADALRDVARSGLAAEKVVKDQIAWLTEQLKEQREQLKRVFNRAEARWQGVHVKNKVLSLHESRVVAIAEGKQAKSNEYGVEVSSRSTPTGTWLVTRISAARSHPEGKYEVLVRTSFPA
jgi:hypothetical protein